MARGEKSCELPSLPLHLHPDHWQPRNAEGLADPDPHSLLIYEDLYSRTNGMMMDSRSLKKDLGLKTRTARPSWECLHVQWRTKAAFSIFLCVLLEFVPVLFLFCILDHINPKLISAISLWSAEVRFTLHFPQKYCLVISRRNEDKWENWEWLKEGLKSEREKGLQDRWQIRGGRRFLGNCAIRWWKAGVFWGISAFYWLLVL